MPLYFLHPKMHPAVSSVKLGTETLVVGMDISLAWKNGSEDINLKDSKYGKIELSASIEF